MTDRRPIVLRSPDVDERIRADWSRHLGRAVDDPQELRFQLGRGSLPAAFSATAARRSSRPAISVGGSQVTHGELNRLASLAGGALRARGIGPGTAVLLSAASSVDVIVAYLGILRTGATVVPVSPGYHPAELSRIIEVTGASTAVASGVGLERIRDAHPTIDAPIGLSADDRAIADAVLGDLIRGAEPIDPPAIDPDAPALFAHTSGTTGRPRCAPLSHRNLLASIRGVMWSWKWSEDDVLLHALPLSHQHGLGGVHATLLAGSRAVIMTRFDPRSLVESLVLERPSVLFGVPAIYRRLVTDLGAEGWKAFRSLRLMTSGSAPLPPRLAREVGARAGRLPLERYGLTETGLDVSTPYTGPNLPGMVGLPLPGIELAIVDTDLESVERGVTGEVMFRGPQVFGGYRGDPEATVAGFAGSWFRTGDLGLVDAETGYLRLVGRTKDVIITGGFNVYPREVEIALLERPDVRDAVVLGIPSDEWGEEVVAFVVPTPGAGVDAATLSSRLELASFKRPKRVLLTDSIPRNDVGKVARETLLTKALEVTEEPGAEI
jgi:malonyl-CoA/methylmalonyl-CoA synthetase